MSSPTPSTASRHLALRGFRKPAELCRPRREAVLELGLAWRQLRHHIERRLARRGLAIRGAGYADLAALESFIEAHLPPVSRRLLDSYDYYRSVCFGRPLLLVDSPASAAAGSEQQGAIRGYFLEEGHGEPTATSYCISLAVEHRLAGTHLGADLVLYSASLAAAAGYRLQRAVVSPHNLPSLATFLNHCGHLVEHSYPELRGYGEPRLAVCAQLTAGAILNHRIDRAGLDRQLVSGQEGVDHLLIDGANPAALQAARERDFYPVALLPKTNNSTASHLLGLPARRLALRYAGPPAGIS